MGMVATLLNKQGERDTVKYTCIYHPVSRVDVDYKEYEYDNVISTWCVYKCNTCGLVLQPQTVWGPE